MKIKQIMEPHVVTVTPETTYEEVARILYDHNISGVPVVDNNGGVIGIVSEKDLYRILYPFYKSFYDSPEIYTDLEERENKVNEVRKHKVERFMTRKVMSVSPDDPIMKAGALMVALNINRLPVVESGKLVGIISRKAIYRAVLKKSLSLE